MEIFPGVWIDAERRFGKACLTGTRLDIATIIASLGAGERIEDVAYDFQITREQIVTALRYAAHVLTHQPPAVKAL